MINILIEVLTWNLSQYANPDVSENKSY